MLQAVYLDVAKVGPDVAHTCMLQAYVKCFRCFIGIFANVSSGCCICLKRFQMFFRRCVSDALFEVFHLPFFMLQLLHLDV
jgi:hypothetical protein